MSLTLFGFIIRAALFGHPMINIDEDFYLLVGDRMLHGALPFIDIWDRKPPGLFLIYAGIRLLGGDGIYQYQVVATGFAVATAWVIWWIARPFTSPRGGWLAGAAYLMWLNLCGGMGGQSPVFYNLPMALAAFHIIPLIGGNTPPRTLLRDGTVAMALVGIAIQIKYSTLFEGAFFGIILLAIRYRMGAPLLHLIGAAVIWAAVALVPTALAAGYFWYIGDLPEFVFTNFASIGLRQPIPVAEVTGRFWVLCLILGPLLILGVIGPNGRLLRFSQGQLAEQRRFLLGWCAVAVGAVVAFGFFYDHYGLPVLLPAAIAAAPLLGTARGMVRAAIAGLLTTALVAGQILMQDTRGENGGWEAVNGVMIATRDQRNCPFLYDGSPSLALLGRWCLPTRWAFSSHLNYLPERTALGVQPLAEIDRVMRTHPDRVIMTNPTGKNMSANGMRLMRGYLRRDYFPVARCRSRYDRIIVYRLREGITPLPNALRPAEFSRQRAYERGLGG